jgi:hypothetical protein
MASQSRQSAPSASPSDLVAPSSSLAAGSFRHRLQAPSNPGPAPTLHKVAKLWNNRQTSRDLMYGVYLLRVLPNCVTAYAHRIHCLAPMYPQLPSPSSLVIGAVGLLKPRRSEADLSEVAHTVNP